MILKESKYIVVEIFPLFIHAGLGFNQIDEDKNQ